MKEVPVVCPGCKKDWVRKIPTNYKEEDDFCDSTSDLCPDCSLLVAFKKNPNGVIGKIRDKQRKEGNPQCFATNRRWKCGEINCGWRFVCNGNMVENVA